MVRQIMGLNVAVLAVGLFAAGIAASPSMHRHGHHHRAEKRDHVVVVHQYEVNHKEMTLDKVCAGLKAGTLRLGDGSTTLDACNTEVPVENYNDSTHKDSVVVPIKKAASTITITSVSSSATATPEVQATIQNEASITTSSSSVSSSSASTAPASENSYSYGSPSATSSAPASTYSNSYDTPSSSDYSYQGQGLDREFPDNEIDCSDFPSDYGAIDIHWMGIGGWSGIQYPKYDGDSVVDMDTAVPGGKNCTANAMCSYACPPGYQKSQWPSTQGATGQSVGGLKCNDQGKLCLTNPALSKTLCVKGTGATTIHNKLGKSAAICRTDYPGTESQTVPLDTKPNSVNPLTCPDAKNYYSHQGAATSAQYYINNKGVSQTEACVWSKDGSHEGNWAPSFLGVGRDDSGRTWLSIGTTSDNKPTDYQPLDYVVEIVAAEGGQLGDTCRLKDGLYCSSDSTGNPYGKCNQKGCTVELQKGEAIYVLTES